MKRLTAKIRRLRTTRWAKLTRGERIAKVIFSLLKAAAVIALIVAVVSAAISIALGIMLAMGIASAIGGGFGYIGYNERVIRFR